MTTRKPILDNDGSGDISINLNDGSRLESQTVKPANKTTSSDVTLPLSWKDYMNCFPILPSFVKLIKNGRSIVESKNLYVHAVRSSGHVIAEELRTTNRHRMDSNGHLIEPAGQRMTSTGRAFSVPFEYRGWFEILSQDGRAVRALDSVKKLVHVFPKRCLVRQTIVGFRRLDESGMVAAEPTKVVEAGTMLRLVETKTTTATMTTRHVSKRRQLLVCKDEQQEEVYFELEQRGLFHPVAGSNDITGVHDVQSILTKFRLPVVVRLVGGNLPRGGSTGMYRIVKEKRDARCFAIALDDSSSTATEGKLIHLSPLDRSQTFLPSTAHKKLVDDALSVQLERRCGSLINDYVNNFHLISTSSATTTDGFSSNARFTKMNLENNSIERARHRSGTKSSAGTTIETQTLRCKMPAETEEDKLLREIEDIYMSVRGIGYVSPQNFTLAASRGMVAGGGVAGSKLQYKAVGGKPTSAAAINTISYASNVHGRNNRPTGERRPVQQSHSFKKNLSGQISNRLTLSRKHPWGSNDELRNMDKSLREKPKSSHQVENNFAAKLMRSSEEQLNKAMKQVYNEQALNGDKLSARININQSYDQNFTLHTAGFGHQSGEDQRQPVRRNNSKDISKPYDNVYEEINKFCKNKPKPNLTDDVKSITQQQQQQQQQEPAGRLFSVGDATNVWASVGEGAKVKTLSRPKSYAGTTAWEDYIIHDIDEINSFAPPVPQRRADSLVSVNAILSTAPAAVEKNQWLSSSAEQDIHVSGTDVKPTDESGVGPRAAGGAKMASSTTEKFSVFSRALLKAFRRFGNRSTRTMVVTDDDGAHGQRAEHGSEPHLATTDVEDLPDVFNESTATTER